MRSIGLNADKTYPCIELVRHPSFQSSLPTGPKQPHRGVASRTPFRSRKFKTKWDPLLNHRGYRMALRRLYCGVTPPLDALHGIILENGLRALKRGRGSVNKPTLLLRLEPDLPLQVPSCLNVWTLLNNRYFPTKRSPGKPFKYISPPHLHTYMKHDRRIVMSRYMFSKPRIVKSANWTGYFRRCTRVVISHAFSADVVA